MAAALPMGGNKVTGAADPTASTDLATKNYVDITTAAFFSTGDVKLTLKTTPDSGWLLFDDGTFGSALSSSSNSNSANNLALFTLFFNNLSDTAAPILTSGGGATTRAAQTNAATAWAANCRMSLPKTLGRALAVAGTGAGLTARPLGSSVGADTISLAANQIPSLSGIASTTDAPNTILRGAVAGTNTTVGNGGSTFLMGWIQGNTLTASSVTSTGTYTNGSQQATSIVQATTFLNSMIKV